jgi:heptosyltransferase-2
MENFERILVRGPNYLGDHVMALPLYASLRAMFPRGHFTLLVPPALTSLRPKGFSAGLALTRGNNALKNLTFDCAINLPASVSAAFLLWKARIPVRFGFAEPLASLFLTRSKPWPGIPASGHKSELYLSLLTLFDYPRPNRTETEFQGLTPLATTKEKLIVIAPGASISLREWPYYGELIRCLGEAKPNYRIVVVGAERDIHWGPTLNSPGALSFTNLIGKTSLPELTHLCSRASLVIGNDSGVAHLAATVSGAPTLVLFGPGNPDYVKPRGEVQIARIELPCSPCESTHCKNPEKKKCLVDLSLDQVLGAALKFLNA